MIEPQISDSARLTVAKAFPHLPVDAAKTAAGWMTLIEEVDARYAERLNPPLAHHSALAFRQMFDPRTRADVAREWRADREPLVRGLADLLALFPPPPIFAAQDLPELQLGPGGVNAFHKAENGA